MNNPFDYTPDEACVKAFEDLVSRLESLKQSARKEDSDFLHEIEAGKMLGVLIATDKCGDEHTFYAFSGQLGRSGFYFPGFVEPVFDYLQPDGYFKKNEAVISGMNEEIALYVSQVLLVREREYEEVKKRLDAKVSAFTEKCRVSKTERDCRRKRGDIGKEELEEMIRRSQYEKAELRRMKKRAEHELSPYAMALDEARSTLDEMKEKRRVSSEKLQQWLFSNFLVTNARGEERSLSEIFATTPLGVPPSGAGECCAPKLLQAAYRRGLTPKAMAEYWYGSPKGGELRIHGVYYPACRGKCLPVLSWMLQGLQVDPPLDKFGDTGITFSPEIIYENEWFCVVNKPSGMLSVPGKGDNISVQQWLQQRYGRERNVRMAHRLDQDTSGLLVATFGDLSYKTIQKLFATRKVDKRYVAVLEGDYKAKDIPEKGSINLPLSPDWLDRPRQHVDIEAGKDALSEYEFLTVKNGKSRVIFHPLTGRTHQLRVHAASTKGLGMPIAGDPLYGVKNSHREERLLLHAHTLEFVFPLDGKQYRFESPVPF